MPFQTNTTNKGNLNDNKNQNLLPHPDYYIAGGDLYFLVEQTLFRVHSYFFLRESKYWQDELATPTSPGDIHLKKGTSDSNAIVLKDEKASDFEKFVWVFYNIKYGIFDITEEEWLIILRYSDIWEFPQVKELAVRYLQQLDMDTIKRIKIYQDNGVTSKYLFPYYVQLASRQELLGLDESRALGLETLVLIHHARERLRAQSSPNDSDPNRVISPVRSDLDSAAIFDIVASTFNFSLKDVDVTDDLANGPVPAKASRNKRQSKSGKTS